MSESTDRDLGHDDRALCWTYGQQSKDFYAGLSWDEVEEALRNGWERVRRQSLIEWEHAKDHVRAAWEA